MVNPLREIDPFRHKDAGIGKARQNHNLLLFVPFFSISRNLSKSLDSLDWPSSLPVHLCLLLSNHRALAISADFSRAPWDGMILAPSVGMNKAGLFFLCGTKSKNQISKKEIGGKTHEV